MAEMCVPGRTQSASMTGAIAFVAVTMTSARRTASSMPVVSMVTRLRSAPLPSAPEAPSRSRSPSARACAASGLRPAMSTVSNARTRTAAAASWSA